MPGEEQEQEGGKTPDPNSELEVLFVLGLRPDPWHRNLNLSRRFPQSKKRRR